MKTKTESIRGRSQDRAKVAGGQTYEVNYEANNLETSADTVKKAIKDSGNARKKVEEKIKK